eukprot:TRINITY_DN47070_c0_g1_i6.p4 TRINITY_DN47070_c0_g1~~TRINITY_DN47070_c0_g1_i6.p4  ORF type:complete len:312 (-),score=33.85 TRINITY_DN47070_c0_g1_i6:2696-3631(-)
MEAALQYSNSGTSSTARAKLDEMQREIKNSSPTGPQQWAAGIKGGKLTSIQGGYEYQYEYEDEDSNSDALSSTSSTGTSTSTMSEEDEFMEEVAAASMHLQQITRQALELLDDMETDENQASRRRRSSRQPSFSYTKPSDHYPLSRHASFNNHANNIDNGKSRRAKKASSSSKRKTSGPGPDPFRQPSHGNQSFSSQSAFQNQLIGANSLNDYTRDLVEKIKHESYSQYSQQQISVALQQHRSEYRKNQALLLQQQQRWYQQQMIMLQAQMLQRRRQLKRSRKQQRNSKVSRSGRLSPIPEVQSTGNSQTE